MHASERSHLPRAARGARPGTWFVLAGGLCAAGLAGCGGSSSGVRAAGQPPAYASDPRAALSALRALTTATLARPEPAKRLLVEGYFMRSLVAAHDALLPAARTAPESALARAALARAIAFADTLAATQTQQGYWPIGYATGSVADMAAALGIFATVEPHVSPARVQRYQAAAEGFVAALGRDGLLLDSGAVGIGWPQGERPANVVRSWRSDSGWFDTEYLVATALAGTSVQSWLFHRTGKEEYRTRARAAFALTLGRMRTDGSLPTFSKHEGPYAVAAYVEEGWMAAVAGLDDPSLLARLRAELPRHVDWLLRTQGQDGTWSSGVPGDFARAPAIAGFLVWYDAACAPGAGVRTAIRRASRALVEEVRGRDSRLHAADEDAEVLRAHTGRPLAALVAGAPVQ